MKLLYNSRSQFNTLESAGRRVYNISEVYHSGSSEEADLDQVDQVTRGFQVGAPQVSFCFPDEEMLLTPKVTDTLEEIGADIFPEASAEEIEALCQELKTAAEGTASEQAEQIWAAYQAKVAAAKENFKTRIREWYQKAEA